MTEWDRWLPERLTGAAVRCPSLADVPLARAVSAGAAGDVDGCAP